MPRRTLRIGVTIVVLLMLLLVIWSSQGIGPDVRTDTIAPPGAGSTLSAPVEAHKPQGPLSLPTPPAEEPETLELAPPPVAAEAEPLDLLLSIRHADGRPALRARVALYSEARQLLAEGEVDHEGRWREAGADGPAVVFVRGVTPTIERFELAEARGTHELVLPEGGVVSGRVLVDGEAPGRPFIFAVTWSGLEDLPWDDYDHENQPAMFRRRGEPLMRIRRGVVTDADGRFELSGVEPGTELVFKPPYLYEVVDEESTPMPVSGPTTEVLFSVRTPPMLRLRVVDQNGTPRGDAVLDIGLSMVMGGQDAQGGPVREHENISRDADRPVAHDGTLAFALGDPIASYRQLGELIRLEFDIVARLPGGSWASAPVDITDFTKDHDLGDIQLTDGGNFSLRVRNADGQPVSDARVFPQSEHIWYWMSPLHCDDDGVVTFHETLAPSRRALVKAQGYIDKLVNLPAVPSDATLDVVLVSDAHVTLRVHGPWERAEPTTGWTFAFGMSGLAPLHDDPALTWSRASPPPFGYRSRPQQVVGEGRLVEIDGLSLRAEWTFDRLRPHHPITLRVGLRAVPEGAGPCPEGWLWEQEVWLEPGEQRVIDVDLSDRLRR